MEILLLIVLIPVIIGISLFFALLTRGLIKINVNGGSFLVIPALFVLGITIVDFLTVGFGFKFWDHSGFLLDGGRFSMVFLVSPAIAIIAAGHRKTRGKAETAFKIIPTIALCVFSIIFMWFYAFIVAGY